MKPERPTHSTVRQGEYFTCRATLGEIACVKLAGKELVTWKHEDYGHRLTNQKRWEQSTMRKLQNQQRAEGMKHG